MQYRLVFAAVFLAVAIPHAQTTAPRAASGLTAVEGLRVGHHTLAERPTGCTVILVDGDAVGGVAQLGGAPGTRETDLLHPLNMVDKVNAVVLSGGSVFGLDAASGVVRWLDEHNIGWPTAAGKVPIVPAAILFDLPVGGNPKVRPSADCGYKAAEAATAGPVAEGSVGAGAGATVGKLGGFAEHDGYPAGSRKPMKAGIGTAAVSLPSGLVVAAIVAVNAVGDIVDPASGRIVAGALNPDGTLADARRILRSGQTIRRPRAGENTTIGVVATNAKLTKDQANRMALMANDGYARAIVPSHTIGDGDAITIGALAAEAIAEAIVRSATEAKSVAGITAARDLKR